MVAGEGMVVIHLPFSNLMKLQKKLIKYKDRTKFGLLNIKQQFFSI